MTDLPEDNKERKDERSVIAKKSFQKLAEEKKLNLPYEIENIISQYSLEDEIKEALEAKDYITAMRACLANHYYDTFYRILDENSDEFTRVDWDVIAGMGIKYDLSQNFIENAIKQAGHNHYFTAIEMLRKGDCRINRFIYKNSRLDLTELMHVAIEEGLFHSDNRNCKRFITYMIKEIDKLQDFQRSAINIDACETCIIVGDIDLFYYFLERIRKDRGHIDELDKSKFTSLAVENNQYEILDYLRETKLIDYETLLLEYKSGKDIELFEAALQDIVENRINVEYKYIVQELVIRRNEAALLLLYGYNLIYPPDYLYIFTAESRERKFLNNFIKKYMSD